MNELTKRIAELKGFSVMASTDRDLPPWTVDRNGEAYSYKKTEDAAWQYIAEWLDPLSLLDEVEQAGYVTEIRYLPEFGYQCTIEEPGPIKLDETVSQCCTTRDEAILKAYIAYRESTESGE